MQTYILFASFHSVLLCLGAGSVSQSAGRNWTESLCTEWHYGTMHCTEPHWCHGLSELIKNFSPQEYYDIDFSR